MASSGREILSFIREVEAHNGAIAGAKVAAANSTIPHITFEDDEEPTTPPGKSRQPKRYVLIVEDDADIRDVVKQCLVDCGYTVKTAVNGQEALDLLDREYMRRAVGEPPPMPSVILLDIMLPVMSGMDFYAVLRRSRPQFASVPVIIMSADRNIGEFTSWAISTEGLDAPRDQLPKPFALGSLIEKVAKAAGFP